MKTLGVIILFVLAVLVSVAISIFIIRQEQNQSNKSRYEIVFGETIHEVQEPSEKPDLVKVQKQHEPVCFKFDRETGYVWRYVSEFYTDPNMIVTTLGFKIVPSESPRFFRNFPDITSDITKVSKRTRKFNLVELPNIPKTNSFDELIEKSTDAKP